MNSQDRPAEDVAESTPVYIVSDDEMLIDAPVDVVWRRAINYPSWQNYSFVRHVSGESGREGEVVLLQKEVAGSASPPTYGRTIKIDAPNRIIWKVYQDGDDFFGIVEFRCEDLNGKTRFSTHSLYEFVRRFQNDGEVTAFREETHKLMKKAHSVTFPTLKEMAERDSRSAEGKS